MMSFVFSVLPQLMLFRLGCCVSVVIQYLHSQSNDLIVQLSGFCAGRHATVCVYIVSRKRTVLMVYIYFLSFISHM